MIRASRTCCDGWGFRRAIEHDASEGLLAGVENTRDPVITLLRLSERWQGLTREHF